MDIHHNKNIQFSLLGVIVTMGIVFGDIGTSPLYVMNALIDQSHKSADFIIGAISCIFWTLTLQTTLKYVFITLNADNKGEGGVFALYALLRRKRKSIVWLAIIGGATLLADGVITPAITVTSAIEGLQIINPEIPILPIVIVIIAVLFILQQFGTEFLGKSFGPIMVVWFLTLGVLGFSQIISYPEIFKALNPYYVFKFLSDNPNGYILLGAVFLCTTGAEALYSDLGHCGAKNIKVSWIFVKAMLVINYLGQGAWVLTHQSAITDTINPFYASMPNWFLLPGIIIATLASIIASQALISGSFTLISEAIQLNLWPKLKIDYPSKQKGQMYIPYINWMLFILCVFVVLFFQHSSNMEAAYGLSITLTMIMTTFLVTFYLHLNKKLPPAITILFFLVFITIELTFLVANSHKFSEGGWFSLLLSFGFAVIMYVLFKSREITKKYLHFVKFKNYEEIIKDLHADKTIPTFASNLVYLTKADLASDIESKTMYSIINKYPKRADNYWFLHVNYLDEPNTLEYKVTPLIDNIAYRIDFNLGFKVSPHINQYYRKVIEDLIVGDEVSIISSFPSLKKHNIVGDFKFVIIDKVYADDFNLSVFKRFVMVLNEYIQKIGISEKKAFGLDTSVVIHEKVPMYYQNNSSIVLKRI